MSNPSDIELLHDRSWPYQQQECFRFVLTPDDKVLVPGVLE